MMRSAAAILLFGLGVFGDAGAAVIAIREEAKVDVKGSSPSAANKEAARQAAIENVWRRYQSQTATGARAVRFAEHGQELREQVETLCTFTFYEEIFDKPTKSYSVRVRASCDENAVDALLERLSPQPKPAAGGSRLPIAFMFLARRAADSREFIDKVSRTSRSTASTVGAESGADIETDAGSGSMSASSDGASVTQTLQTESKGTVDRRDTAFQYVVEQSEGVDNAVTNVLATAGFDVAKYSDVVGSDCPGASVNEVTETFAKPQPNQAELVPAEIRRRMIDASRTCEMAFFAMGLLDILKSEQMPDGLWRVTVALTIDVRDIRRRVPTAVAAIPQAQFQQKGRDRIEAANLALTMAAQNGTREIVDMLRLRGIY